MLLCLLCVISYLIISHFTVLIFLHANLHSFEYLQLFYRLDEVLALSGQAELFLDFHCVSSVEAGRGDESILVTYFARCFGLGGF